MIDQNTTDMQFIRNRIDALKGLGEQLYEADKAKTEMLIGQINHIAENYYHDVTNLLDVIDNALYQLETLEPVLELPERGYVRNSFRRVLMTLRGEW